ncbi:MAG: stage II sporulation protein D [Sporolactobacillus sp.]
MKKSIYIFLVSVLIIIIIPAMIVLPFRKQTTRLHLPIIGQQMGVQKKQTPQKDTPPTIAVYRSVSGVTEEIDLTNYLIGVVGSEMPARFPIEALKAQAMAARTYILDRLQEDPGARVTDTVQNQVYHSRAELKKLWGDAYTWKIKKITRAVKETKNEVITYNGHLIAPVFFSTSNGYTENAEAYWSEAVPYLRSVASPWDQSSPKFRETKTIPAAAAAAALGVTLSKQNGRVGQVVARTASHHVSRFEINGHPFTGREIREKLALSSTDFVLTRKGDSIIAQTVGSGHDVGMSQYGAAGMAKLGKTAKQIVTYYYSGTKVTTLTPQAELALAKK